MAQIGRGEATKEWQKLDDVVDGFSPETDGRYELQNIANEELQICEGASKPTDERDGFIVKPYDTAELKKEAGIDFWVRAKYNSTIINLGTL